MPLWAHARGAGRRLPRLLGSRRPHSQGARHHAGEEPADDRLSRPPAIRRQPTRQSAPTPTQPVKKSSPTPTPAPAQESTGKKGRRLQNQFTARRPVRRRAEPAPQSLWKPRFPELPEMCASCPFREGNDQAFGDILTRIKKKHGERRPATAREITTARAKVKFDRLFSGEFCCHNTVYDAQMNVQRRGHWKQCAGAAAHFRTKRNYPTPQP